ncbi:MAG: polyprenyl synthetase family protein [Candidatus Gribaldobacteria bacterium]|nr:polyprenyl synthetase family protein [Candidatus Gribaldobacteria bacterium]
MLNELLIKQVDPRFHEMLKYPVATGGKRLRPFLCLVSCLAMGGKLQDALYPAVGLEILHNYTLILDDTIDHGEVRRGQPTIQVKYGSSMAECTEADFAASFLSAAAQSKKPKEVALIFAKALKVVVDGEIDDILFERIGRENEPFIVKERPSEISEEQYFEMIKRKTAFLLQTCCEVGGLMAGVNEIKLKALRNYGLNLGLAFQVQDDVLDMFGDEEKFGKKVGKDLEEHKGGNIILIYALEELKGKNKDIILGILKGKKVKPGDIKKAIVILSQTKAQEKAEILKEKLVQKAQSSLNSLPASKWRNVLASLADFVIKRDK